MDKYNQHPEVVCSTDKKITTELSMTENELALIASSDLIERGYPLPSNDAYLLAQKIYEGNYGNPDDQL